MKRAMHWVLDRWFQPVRAEWSDFFVRVFASTFLIYMMAWSRWAAEWLTDYGFHISAEATSRAYPTPAPLLAHGWETLFLTMLYSVIVAVILAPHKRVFLVMIAGLAYYVQMVDQPSSFTLNKLYVVFFTLMALRPRSVTLDGVRMMSAWPIRIVQASLVIQYTTAGICKSFHGDWFKVHDILFGHSVGIYRTEIAALAAHYLPHFAWIALSYGAIAFELGAAPLFLIRKLRLWGVAIGTIMHFCIAILMADLIYFSLQMIAFYLFFVDERWVVQWEQWTQRQLKTLAARVPSLKDFQT